MITGKMNRKHQQSINHANVEINLMVKNIIQIKSEIIINLDVSLKNMIYVRKIILGILLYVVLKMVII